MLSSLQGSFTDTYPGQYNVTPFHSPPTNDLPPYHQLYLQTLASLPLKYGNYQNEIERCHSSCYTGNLPRQENDTIHLKFKSPHGICQASLQMPMPGATEARTVSNDDPLLPADPSGDPLNSDLHLETFSVKTTSTSTFSGHRPSASPPSPPASDDCSATRTNPPPIQSTADPIRSKRLAIVPHNKLAKADHIMVETKPHGQGRLADGSIKMTSLSDLPLIHEELKKYHSHIKEKNRRLRIKLWNLYATESVECYRAL